MAFFQDGLEIQIDSDVSGAEQGIGDLMGTLEDAEKAIAGFGSAGGAGGMGVGTPVVELHVGDGADDLTKVIFDALKDDIETTIRKREQAQHRRSKRVNRRDG